MATVKEWNTQYTKHIAVRSACKQPGKNLWLNKERKKAPTKEQKCTDAAGYDWQTSAARGIHTMSPSADQDQAAEVRDNIGAAATEVRYVQADICNEWEEWMKIFEEELKFQKAEVIEDKVTCLRRYKGNEIRNLVKHLPESPVANNPEINGW